MTREQQAEAERMEALRALVEAVQLQQAANRQLLVRRSAKPGRPSREH